ncbi:hypothetical protein [Paenarthrobacter nitroguajacolicus]
MSDRTNRLKSVGISLLSALATSAQEVLGRDTALKSLKIDIKANEYKEVIGKLAYSIVELQGEIVDLRAEIAELRGEAGTR